MGLDPRNFAPPAVFQNIEPMEYQVLNTARRGTSAVGTAYKDRDRENAEDLVLFREFSAGLAAMDSPQGVRQAREAYTKIYLRYRERVYSYCLRILCNEQDAQDLFQDVFVRLYTRASSFEQEKSLGGWIFTIAHNLCLNRIRDRKPYEDIEDLPLLTMPSEDFGENWPERIEWALAQLPVEYREALVLREYQGLSYTEIAEVLKTTLPAIKSRIYRAKENLRELLGPYYNERID